VSTSLVKKNLRELLKNSKRKKLAVGAGHPYHPVINPINTYLVKNAKSQTILVKVF